MPFGSLPDIPGAEHPEHEWLKEAAKDTAAEKVAGLDIGLDLRRHPEINSRLAEIGSHFEDSLAMARMIQTVYEPLRAKLGLADEGPERLMRAAVLHDIGKSGPAGAETGFHDAVRRLFITPTRPFNHFAGGRNRTISEFLAEQELPDGAGIAAELRQAGIDPDQEAMIDFWRRHAQWTYDLLRTENGPDIDEDMIKIAATHHLLEGRNPAQLKLDEVPAEAHVLEVLEESELLAAVDKYQALRQRVGLPHEEVIKKLNAMIDARTELPETLRQKFRTIIEIIGNSREALEEFLGGKRA